ncbi:MAG TPA: histidinol dehydrogenase [Rhodospirillaceae bacterium]|nr:histidinol dehydrogenase [Magnetovibrio sp.]HBT43482.1 histidinol dehydrogenase [Rhodospirillaceae bacterium]HCS71354.1 histidinol dehydrogenase [Rhodospirillaceae bacterium]|tara:strand:+ start:6896 stop:8200 length:1305 start_codon:yes stop_codon:yes gene_type:complete
MPLRLDSRDPGFEDAFKDLLGAKRESEADVNDVVTAILADVRARGDAAVLDYTKRFDRFDLTAGTMAITPEEVDAARGQCTPETLSALATAAGRIRAFHEKQLPEDLDFTDAAGLRLGYRWQAVEAAGLYVPGGTAAYPSSVLMNAIPAKVAGVDRLVMVVPTPDGVLNPLVLAAAAIAGVDEIYRIGGAQAVGALAYGTETIRPVDKIVGPGNAYVAAAKRLVFGTVGIDMIAGPSEILVLADGANDPAWIAADLLSQAEHDTAAQAILITDDAAFADAVERAVEGHLKTLPRTGTAGESWATYGAVITVPDLAGAIPLVDRIAPEHLEIATDNADTLGRKVRNAGAIFMGRYVPEAIGDYIAGPNHVLPTARSARFSSGLGVLDFMKRSSLIECDAEGLRAIGPEAVALARAEGLDAHALSISIRLNTPAGD